MRTSFFYEQSAVNARCFLLTATLLMSATDSISQIIYPPGRINAHMRSGGLVVPINYVSKTEKEREQYISDQWNEGTIILLTGDSIHHYPLKYNLTTDAVEVKAKNAVKLVPLDQVQRFYWVEKGQRFDYINSSGYTIGTTPLAGYLQLLSEGPLNLFKKTFLSVQKANYRPELDVGSPEDRIIRKQIYYVARGTNMLEVKPKNIYAFFKQHRADIKKYAKRNNLQPKREKDLIAMVDYYNQLLQ